MKRTQIYLNNDQYNNLLIESRKRSKTISDLIREAVDKSFGAKKDVGLDRATDNIFGLWEKRKDIISGMNYVDNIRKDSRIKDLYKDAK